jgi:hypothetical protein
MTDVAAARLLLEAGIDPNDIGDLDGDLGTPDTAPMLKSFKWLRGRSPLSIAREPHRMRFDTDNVWFRGYVKYEKSKVEDLELLLIQYGGRDFTTSPGQDPLHATQAEMGALRIGDKCQPEE